jgi:hypothetical protein
MISCMQGVKQGVIHVYVHILAKAPNRILSFSLAHLFKELQLVEEKGYVSRALLCKELSVGEGVVRTLLNI